MSSVIEIDDVSVTFPLSRPGLHTVKRKIINTPRVGDHIWYISDTSKFKKHYPKWRQKYNIKKIIEELIEHQK